MVTSSGLVSTALLNAVIGPDARMGGATDCYHVPTDDVDALRAWVSGREEER